MEAALWVKSGFISAYFEAFVLQCHVYAFHARTCIVISESTIKRLEDEAECERLFLAFREGIEELAVYEELSRTLTDEREHFLRIRLYGNP